MMLNIRSLTAFKLATAEEVIYKLLFRKKNEILVEAFPGSLIVPSATKA